MHTSEATCAVAGLYLERMRERIYIQIGAHTGGRLIFIIIIFIITDKQSAATCIAHIFHLLDYTVTPGHYAL